MTACPVCGSRERAAAHREGEYRYVRCLHCDLVRMDPLPTTEEQARRHRAYLPSSDEGGRVFDLVSRAAWARIRSILVRDVGTGRLLDVGCGNGTFLARMRTAGWDVTGVEVSPAGAARTARRGIRVLAGDDGRIPSLSETFHAVTALHVIEHVPDPLGLLEACRKTLRPGGTLLLRYPETTPLKDVLARLGIRNRLYDAPYHVLDFSPTAMRRTLDEAGFRGVRILGGGVTLPIRGNHRTLGFLTSVAGDLLGLATGGRALVPGTSKIAVARRGP